MSARNKVTDVPPALIDHVNGLEGDIRRVELAAAALDGWPPAAS